VASGDRHVYAARTRFIPDRLLGLFEKTKWSLAVAGAAARTASRARALTSAPACAGCGDEFPRRTNNALGSGCDAAFAGGRGGLPVQGDRGRGRRHLHYGIGQGAHPDVRHRRAGTGPPGYGQTAGVLSNMI
jgi:hypothetical protein